MMKIRNNTISFLYITVALLASKSSYSIEYFEPNMEVLCSRQHYRHPSGCIYYEVLNLGWKKNDIKDKFIDKSFNVLDVQGGVTKIEVEEIIDAKYVSYKMKYYDYPKEYWDKGDYPLVSWAVLKKYEEVKEVPLTSILAIPTDVEISDYKSFVFESKYSTRGFPSKEIEKLKSLIFKFDIRFMGKPFEFKILSNIKIKDSPYEVYNTSIGSFVVINNLGKKEIIFSQENVNMQIYGELKINKLNSFVILLEYFDDSSDSYELFGDVGRFIIVKREANGKLNLLPSDFTIPKLPYPHMY